MGKKKSYDVVPAIIGIILVIMIIWVGYQIVAAPIIQAQNIKTDLNKMYLYQAGETGYNVSEVTFGYTAKLQNGTILYVNEKGCSGCGEGYYLDTEQRFMGCECPNIGGIILIIIIAGIVIFVGLSMSPTESKIVGLSMSPTESKKWQAKQK